MKRLSGSHFNSVLVYLAVLWLGLVYAQDPFGDVLASNSQLWKSFQAEMKTLESAAHRVNTLLSSAHHQKPETPDQDDQEAKAAEDLADVTVLTSPDVMKNGVLTKPFVAKNEEIDKKQEITEGGSQPDGVKQPISPHLNFGSFLNSFGFFKNLPEPWWKGKNVCVEKSEKVEDKHNGKNEMDKHVLIMGTGTFEHCKQTAGKYICTTVMSTPQSTKTVSTTYQCCEGYRREADGCVQGEHSSDANSDSKSEPEYKPDKDAVPHSRYGKVNSGKSFEDSFSSRSDEGNVELKDVVDVLDTIGSKDFASLMKSQNLMRILSDQNITIFAPVDKAMRSHHIDFQESNQIRQSRHVRAVEWRDSQAREQLTLSGKDILLSHITPSLLDVDDFTNEMVVKSSYKDSPLRVNVYPGRQEAVMTVNCARVQSWDHLASHARVHTVDRVLEPVTLSVLDILSLPQFSQFRQYLEQEGELETLANASAVTVFAPNNEAWDKLGEGLRDKYARGEACIGRVLRHHILPLTLCAAPTTEGRLTTADIDGELVRLGRDQDNLLMVDGKGRVVQEDIVATNGVVHVLDKVLTPKSAKPLSELLVSSNHTTWLSLLDKAGLMEELNKQENITMFVPTERVLSEDNTRSLLDSLDTEALRQVLLYHVTQQAPTCELHNHAQLRTQTGATLRVTMFNPYAMFSGVEPRVAVQCAPLGYTDGKACHVVAHEVTRLLLPPNSTVHQLISDDPQLSFLKRVMEGTEIGKELEEKSELLADGFTLLAPTDESFNKLEEDMLTKLLTDKKFADEIIRMHVLKEPICCASITSVPWPFTNSVKTVDGRKIEVNRDKRNRVLFGSSATEKCDVIATDGIVHLVDNVLLPETTRVKLGNIAFGTPDKKIMLFGI